jgi:hypothetical protein
MDLGERSNRRDVVRRSASYQFELALRRLELVERDKRSTKSHARRQILWVNLETGTTDRNRFSVAPSAAQLFGQLRKSDRTRILAEAASKIFYPRIVGHERDGTYFTVT